MLYKIFWHILKLIYCVFGNINYYGKENIIKENLFLIVSNHISNLDPILIALALKKEMAFLAKDSLFKNIFFTFILNKINVKPIRKNNNFKDSINEMISYIKEGKPIVLFPEGTRNKTISNLLPFKQGAALIAIKSQIPIIPVAISKNKKNIIFGKKIIPPIENTKKTRIKLTNCFEKKIYNLLKKIN